MRVLSSNTNIKCCYLLLNNCNLAALICAILQ